MPTIDTDSILRIALVTKLEKRAIVRVYNGGPARPSTRETVTAAARALGIALPREIEAAPVEAIGTAGDAQ